MPGLDGFGAGCALVAEGVETEAEQKMLVQLAVSFGQGYLLGPPAPLSDQGLARAS